MLKIKKTYTIDDCLYNTTKNQNLAKLFCKLAMNNYYSDSKKDTKYCLFFEKRNPIGDKETKQILRGVYSEKKEILEYIETL